MPRGRRSQEPEFDVVAPDASAMIEDLKTVNGTLVNGQEVKGRQPLESGDTVRFGDSEFTVELIA